MSVKPSDPSILTTDASTSGGKRGQALLSKRRYALLEQGFKDILQDRCLHGQEDDALNKLMVHIQETLQFDPDASTYASRDTKKVIERQRVRNTAIKDLAGLLRSKLGE